MRDARIDLRADGTSQTLILSGDWTRGATPEFEELDLAGCERLRVDGEAIGEWDSSLIAYSWRALRQAQEASVAVDVVLPDGAEQLLELADAVPRDDRRQKSRSRHAIIFNPVSSAQTIGKRLRQEMEFIGGLLRAGLVVVSGRSRMRTVDVASFCAQAGSQALPIISLTSLLVGMILGYLGAVQLQEFGAAIYVANLVTVGILREMGPLMTAIILAGRTGAAYAAQLGTMQVNEEVDAIELLGVSPAEFLIMPRLLGVLFMMPLLVVYADLIGIVGGGIVASGLGVTPLQYVIQVDDSLLLSHLLVGLAKGIVFALLIGIAGCRAGMLAGRSSEGVGRATTEAVVTALVYLIIADAGINIFCQLVDL